MKIHEYQAKDLLRAYGAPCGDGIVIEEAEDGSHLQKVREAAQSLFQEGHSKVVVKAQIHSGGRGKAGGVKLVSSPEEAENAAKEMFGKVLVTKQTGPEGKRVQVLYLTPAVDMEKEFYLSLTWNMEQAAYMIVASADGGMEIEETAQNHPELIVQIPVSPQMGFRAYEGLAVAQLFGLSGEAAKELQSLLGAMTRLYAEKDCSLIEINPLILTKEGHLFCLDAKITFDDNALFRHPELLELRDIREENPKEYKASLQDLSYVSMDGNIGCLVNGAGLAMATMDILHAFGGEAANFLDVGGSATTERVKAAFELLLSDGQVEAIFVNIFGGIMKCDVIAEGIVAAAKEIDLKVPLVVRLEGTNVDRGREILAASGLPIISAGDMAEGSRRAIEAARSYGQQGSRLAIQAAADFHSQGQAQSCCATSGSNECGGEAIEASKGGAM